MLEDGSITSLSKTKEISFSFYHIPITSKFLIFHQVETLFKINKISDGPDYLSLEAISTITRNLSSVVLTRKLLNLSKKVSFGLFRSQLQFWSLFLGKLKNRFIFKDRPGGKPDKRHIKTREHIQQRSLIAIARKLNKNNPHRKQGSIIRHKRSNPLLAVVVIDKKMIL